MTHDKALLDRASHFADVLRGRPNAFAFGTSSLTDYGAVTSCSTFIGRLLQQLFEEAPHSIPRARRWIDHLEPVAWADVLPGHIGVIQYDEDRERMSGHCFVLAQKGQQFARTYALEVIDSCRSSHGSDDTRMVDGKPLGGIGRGIMLVSAGELAKEVDSYRWSTSPSSEVMPQGQGQRLVFGRVPRSWTLKEISHG